MNLILVAKTNFDQMWAGEYLEDILTPSSNVLVFHFQDDHEYDLISFDYEGDIIRPFLTYGMTSSQVKVVHPYVDDIENIVFELEQDYDVICFVGNHPYQAILYLEDYNLKEWFQFYEGTLLFVGEIGYISTKYIQDGVEGLNLLDELDVDINYRYDEEHMERVIRLLEMGDSRVVLIPEDGGLLMMDHYYDFMGNASIVGEEDLDSLYETYRNSL